MKHFTIGMLIALTLVVALVLGVAALAETAEAPELPAAGDTQETAPAESADNDALQAALNALYNARSESRTESLEAELKGYVEAGKLTQAQADLILNYEKERQSLKNGVCPGCGYQFQGNTGRMNGGRGGRKGGRMNGGMNGGMRGMGQMGQMDNTAYMPDEMSAYGLSDDIL